MAKNSFILHNNHLKPFLKLSDSVAGKLFKSIANYQLNGEKPVFEDEQSQFIFDFFEEQIDFDSQKYTDLCLKNAKNASLGGIATAAVRQRSVPIVALSDTDTDTGSSIEENKEKKYIVIEKSKVSSKPGKLRKEKISDSEKWVNLNPPTLKEVEEFIAEKDLWLDPELFLDTQTQNQWTWNDKKYKDWKLVARTWASRVKFDKAEDAAKREKIRQKLWEKEAILKGRRLEELYAKGDFNSPESLELQNFQIKLREYF